MKKANFGVFCDFRVFRLLNQRSIRGHPLHISQKNHKTTIILVQEDVDGPKRTPLLIDFSSSLQNQPVWDVLLEAAGGGHSANKHGCVHEQGINACS